MKKKIQHDAINNQEDEDSSAYPIYFLSDETFNKKKKEAVRNNIGYFSNEGSKNQDDLELNRKYRQNL